MPAPPDGGLPESVDALRILQGQGRIAIRSRDLSRTHCERLVKNGFLHWNPDDDQDDLEQPNALAARGYFDAFQSVKDIPNEEQACVRAVLGHFVFVYIHPYMDGNGRVGRFLMYVMLASGG